MSRKDPHGTAICCALFLAAVLAAGPSASALVTPPSLRALELPAGYLTISADNPLLNPILNGATSSTGGTVVHDQAGRTLPLGKTLVTWRDLSNGLTASKYIYLYPYGWQVLGVASNIRIFEHNGARHILYDRDNRVHVIFNDGLKVWYRLGVRSGGRLQWRPAVQVNDSSTPIGSTSLGTRGQTMALFHDTSGNVVLQCVWSSSQPVSRTVHTRRLVVDAAGTVSLGSIVNTGLIGNFPSIVADSTNKLHLAIESSASGSSPWIHYVNSTDGQTWSNQHRFYGSQFSCDSYRFVNLVVDPHDRIHALWQAGSYLGYDGSPNGTWWVGLYTVRDPQTGGWSTPANVVQGIAGWQAPAIGQQILFAYPNMVIDDAGNLHISWHGTARSLIYAWDDVFYLKRYYNAGTDTWGSWTDYTVLHSRDHFNNGNGEDRNYSWVPSMAFKPGTDDLYTIFMFGTDDDEIDPALNLTDGALKKKLAGIWQPSFENVTRTDGLRSWYPNVPTRVLVDPNGRTWLDMIWIDGTEDDYNIIFRRIDLKGGGAGDISGDGRVTVFDLNIMAASWNKQLGQQGYDPRADLNADGQVNGGDLNIVATNWGR